MDEAKRRIVAAAITAKLQEASAIRSDWLAFSVSHIPCNASRTVFFLLVNVNVRPEMNARDRLPTACVQMARSVLATGLLTAEKAVEISAWVDVSLGPSPKRVFRLIIDDYAFDTLKHQPLSDLLSQAHDGITLQWPLKHVV